MGAFMLARQKLDWGLVNLVAPDNGLAATLADLVATLAEKKAPSACAA